MAKLLGGSHVYGDLLVDGLVDGVDVASFKSSYDSHLHDGRYILEGGDTMGGILDLGGNDLEDGTTTLWDASAGHVPQGRLQNDAVTVNAGTQLTGGGSVSLGGSVTLNISEGSGSGLDADLLDGNHAGAFALDGHNHDGSYILESGDTMGGTLTLSDGSAAASEQYVDNNAGGIQDGDPIPHPSYASKSDIPSLTAADVVHVSSDGLYIEQDATADNSSKTPLQLHKEDADAHTPLQNDLQNHKDNTNAHPALQDNVLLAEGTGTNINGSNYVTWDATNMNDSAYSFDGQTVTFDTAGSYEITADADFYSTNARTNPNLYIEHYDGSSWNWAGVFGRSGYMRNASGHDHSSVHAHAVIEVSSGEQVRVRGAQEAQSESITPDRSMFLIKKMSR